MQRAVPPRDSESSAPAPGRHCNLSLCSEPCSESHGTPPAAIARDRHRRVGPAADPRGRGGRGRGGGGGRGAATAAAAARFDGVRGGDCLHPFFLSRRRPEKAPPEKARPAGRMPEKARPAGRIRVAADTPQCAHDTRGPGRERAGRTASTRGPGRTGGRDHDPPPARPGDPGRGSESTESGRGVPPGKPGPPHRSGPEAHRHVAEMICAGSATAWRK
jgi:hypothetical protein